MQILTKFYFFQPANASRENLYIKGGTWTPVLGAAIRRSGVTHIVIDHWDGEGLDFLLQYRDQIRTLTIGDSHIKDISAVSRLENLEAVSIAGAYDQIEFGRLRRLRQCSIESRTVSENLCASSGLEGLVLSGCSSRDLRWISPLKNLVRLELQDMPLQSLAGIEALQRLQKLHIGRSDVEHLDGVQALKQLSEVILGALKRLGSIAALSSLPAVKELWLESCKRVKDLTCISTLTSLHKLTLVNMGDIDSARFLGPLTELQILALGDNTRIVDGDLRVLLALPKLKSALFRNRKHYSHTMDEIKRFLDLRQIETQ